MRKVVPFIIILFILVIVSIKILPFFKSVVPTATNVVFHSGATLKEVNGRTNIILLGIGGGTHDGPDLTDTIIFASINWNKNSVTLLSVPRDLWIPSMPIDPVKKINEVYANGEANTPPTGLKDAEQIVSQVTGQPIQYGIRLDFQGFVDGINAIGGVDVNVQRTLDDYEYPIDGMEDDPCGHSQQDIQQFEATDSSEVDGFTFFDCRYKHLHFDPGVQHMDGETALEYARSRHGVGIEGTDFARSARQQLVIEAVRNKLVSSALFNPGEILKLYGIVSSSIDTNITDKEIGLFLDKLPQLKSAKISSNVLDEGNYTTGRAGLLVLAPVSVEYDNLSVQIPRVGDGNFTEIQKYVTCLLTKGTCTVTQQPASNEATNSTVSQQ